MVRISDSADMTSAVYCGHKATNQTKAEGANTKLEDVCIQNFHLRRYISSDIRSKIC